MDKEFRLKDGLHVSGNAAIIGSITTVDSVQFNLTHNVVNTIGGIDWSVDDSTIELGLTPNVTLQVGQEQLYLVKNQTGADIPDGTAVMAIGTLGNSGRILIGPAIANGSVVSKRVIGVTTERIANGADGFVSSFGKVRGLDTSMWSEGDILYVSPSTPGALSNTQPVAPNNKITLAFVISKSVNNGTIFVRPTFGSAIQEDENVHIDSIVDGQILIWNSATGRFENKTYTGYQANDYTTYTAALANDYNTLLSARSNDYNTLLSAYSNDGSTLLTARSNDFSTYSTLAANDGATLLTARANDYTTLLAAYSNDGSTLASARANDFSTWSGLNSYVNLKANTASPVFTGNVGIGTGSPSAKIQILTDSLGPTAGDEQTAAIFSALDSASVINIKVKTIRHTAAANWPNTETRLQYDVDSNASKNMWISFYNDSGTVADNIMRFGEGTSTEWMRIDNGLVGIGTPTPASTLDVNGDVTIADKIIHSGDTNTAIRFPAADTFTVETSGLERIRVTNSGLVGIGTAAPDSPLTIVSTNSAVSADVAIRNTVGSSALYFQSANTGTNLLSFGDTQLFNSGFIQYTHSSDTWLQRSAGPMVFQSGGANERVRIDSSGNLGIGIAAPTVKLHLYDGNTAISLNEVAAGGSGVASWRLKHGLNHYGAYVSAANALVFYDYGATAERMRLDNLGNLGIGVISPAQRLDISGNVKISGGIVANNSLGSASQVLTSNGSGIYWSTPTTGSTAYSATIGNGSANTFIITHNLGTQNIFTSIRDTATNYFVYPDIKYNNTNSITIEFSSVPTANSYYVAILGA